MLLAHIKLPKLFKTFWNPLLTALLWLWMDYNYESLHNFLDEATQHNLELWKESKICLKGVETFVGRTSIQSYKLDFFLLKKCTFNNTVHYFTVYTHQSLVEKTIDTRLHNFACTPLRIPQDSYYAMISSFDTSF